LRGLALARERGLVLVWDAHHWLYLFNRDGEPQGQRQISDGLATACCADDGSVYAAAGSQGEVVLLAPDLMPRWQTTLPHRATAVALDSLGQLLAVADSGGDVHCFDASGKLLWRGPVPRALHHLAFVPEKPVLLGAADFGLVLALDRTGKILWRDGLVAHIGSLGTDGPGRNIVLACFSEGLCGYDLAGKKNPFPIRVPPCRLASLSFDGRLLLADSMSHRLELFSVADGLRSGYALDGPAAALALGPLGEQAIVGLAEGKLLSLVPSARPEAPAGIQR
jgi:hypothetical protein